MRKFCSITLLVLILSALIMVGCSSPAPSSSVQPTTQAPTSKPATSAPATSSSPVATSKPASSTAPATSTTAAGKVIELRFSHHNPPTGWTTVNFLNPWAKKVEEATKGRVKVTMYAAESLAKSTENVQATIGGVADISWTIMGFYAGRYPLSSVMALPFLSLGSGHVNGKVVSGGLVNSHIIQELYETVPEIQAEWKDLKVLYLNCTDPYLLMTKKPVKNLSDLSGLKIRELGGYPSDFWKALGASPLLRGMPEIYDAASKGVIDGANLPWSAVATYKFYEVLKYYTEAPTMASPQMVIMNKDTWNSLPKDIQDQIMSVSGIWGAEFAGDTGWGNEVKDLTLDQMQKAGFKMESVPLDAGELDKWKALGGKPIWDKWVAEMNGKGLAGQKVLDATLKLLDKYK